MTDPTYIYPCPDCTTFAARVKGLESGLDEALRRVEELEADRDQWRKRAMDAECRLPDHDSALAAGQEAE